MSVNQWRYQLTGFRASGIEDVVAVIDLTEDQARAIAHVQGAADDGPFDPILLDELEFYLETVAL